MDARPPPRRPGSRSAVLLLLAVLAGGAAACGVDTCFVVDASTSIVIGRNGASTFRLVTRFVRDTIAGIAASGGDSRYGAAYFGTTARDVPGLGTLTSNTAAAEQAVLAIPTPRTYPPAYTNMEGGIARCYGVDSNGVPTGILAASPQDRPRMIIMLTDGEPNRKYRSSPPDAPPCWRCSGRFPTSPCPVDRRNYGSCSGTPAVCAPPDERNSYSECAAVATRLRVEDAQRAGITFVSVGVGSGINSNLLQDISDQYFRVNQFSELSSFVTDLAKQVCTDGSITKTVEPSTMPVPVNTTLTYTVRIANTGREPIRPVRFQDVMPDGVAYVRSFGVQPGPGSAPSDCTFAAQAKMLTCIVQATLLPGREWSYSYQAVATSTGQQVNTVLLVLPDNSRRNNNASVIVNVLLGCPAAPQLPPNGAAVQCAGSAPYAPGTSCPLTCVNGFVPSGPVTCRSDNTWSAESCSLPPCPASPVLPAAGVATNCSGAGPYPSGHACSLTCATGFTASSGFVCTSGLWNTPTCTPKLCQADPVLPKYAENATCPGSAPYTNGTTCTLNCRSGYVASNNFVCRAGTWSKPTCTAQACDAITPPECSVDVPLLKCTLPGRPYKVESLLKKQAATCFDAALAASSGAPLAFSPPTITCPAVDEVLEVNVTITGGASQECPFVVDVVNRVFTCDACGQAQPDVLLTTGRGANPPNSVWLIRKWSHSMTLRPIFLCRLTNVAGLLGDVALNYNGDMLLIDTTGQFFFVPVDDLNNLEAQAIAAPNDLTRTCARQPLMSMPTNIPNPPLFNPSTRGYTGLAASPRSDEILVSTNLGEVITLRFSYANGAITASLVGWQHKPPSPSNPRQAASGGTDVTAGPDGLLHRFSARSAALMYAGAAFGFSPTTWELNGTSWYTNLKLSGNDDALYENAGAFCTSTETIGVAEASRSSSAHFWRFGSPIPASQVPSALPPSVEVARTVAVGAVSLRRLRVNGAAVAPVCV